MINRLKQLWSDKFVRGTFILTGTGFLGSVFNYLVHPIVSRNLSVAAYGDFQALLSFISVFGIIGAVIYTSLTKEISTLAAGNFAVITALRRRAVLWLSVAGLILFLLVLVFSGPLHSLFNISQTGLLIISSLILLYTYPLIVNRATLAGLQHFSVLSALNLSDPTFRLLLVVLLVSVWSWGIIGAAWALGLTSLVGLGLSFWAVRRLNLGKGSASFNYPWTAIGRYALLVLWFTALAQFFYNFDMLFIKSAFSPEEAGLYGALLTVGRIIFFVGGAVPLVMFPVIAGLRADPSARRLFVLLKSLGLMSLLTVPAGVVIALWPGFMIRIVVGVKYLAVAPYLPLFALAMLLLTLLTVLSQYFLALSRRRGLIVLTVAAFVEALLLALFHADFWQVIWVIVVVYGLADLVLVGLLVWEYRQLKRGELAGKLGSELEPLKTEIL